MKESLGRKRVQGNWRRGKGEVDEKDENNLSKGEGKRRKAPVTGDTWDKRQV